MYCFCFHSDDFRFPLKCSYMSHSEYIVFCSGSFPFCSTLLKQGHLDTFFLKKFEASVALKKITLKIKFNGNRRGLSSPFITALLPSICTRMFRNWMCYLIPIGNWCLEYDKKLSILLLLHTFGCIWWKVCYKLGIQWRKCEQETTSWILWTR